MQYAEAGDLAQLIKKYDKNKTPIPLNEAFALFY
jgi:hypothetical protein